VDAGVSILFVAGEAYARQERPSEEKETTA
jgi:hypothetical protein